MFGKYNPGEVTQDNYEDVFEKELFALFVSGMVFGVLIAALGLVTWHEGVWGIVLVAVATALATWLMANNIRKMALWWSIRFREL